MIWFLSEKYLPAALCCRTQAESTELSAPISQSMSTAVAFEWFTLSLLKQLRSVFKVNALKGASEALLNIYYSGK